MPEVQARWRAAGATGLKLAPVGTGVEHLFIVLNRPLDGSTPKVGRDLSEVAEPAEALRAARSSGEVAASRTYVLLKDRDLPAAQQQMSFDVTTFETRARDDIALLVLTLDEHRDDGTRGKEGVPGRVRLDPPARASLP